MIRPLAHSEKLVQNYVVTDIENLPDGSVLTIDTCWRENGKKIHQQFDNWRAWWKWLCIRARNDERFRCIYAHNGGGWDWLSLVSYLLREGRKEYQFLTGITAQSKLVTVTVQVGKKFTIALCDSLQLLRSPLSVLAKKFDVTNKIDLGGKLPHEIYESNRPLYDAYVSADTESLLEVMEKANRIINENVAPIGEFGFTIGSTAMKVFRSMLTKDIFVPMDDKLKDFLREGYKGGRVETFQYGYFPNVTVYDVNSLYPYAMLTTDVPISDRGCWTDEFDSTCPGIYEIAFEQRNRDIPPVLMLNGAGAYEGSGVFYSPEIALLREVGNARIDIKRGYKFLDYERLFEDYVNRLYNLRLTDSDGPISLMSKYLLNSLYGKFAQNPTRESLLVFDDFDTLDAAITDGNKITLVDDELGVYRSEGKHAAAFEHVGIAGMITSQARCILYRGILSAGVNNVIYCDTDSVHTTNCLQMDLVGSKIGQFKIEFKGEGCYVGKKLYALRRPEWYSIGKRWYTKLRAKGVTIGGRNGCAISFDDFRAMAESESKRIECRYQQPATAREVFKGAKACIFQSRKRTIGRTDNR